MDYSRFTKDQLKAITTYGQNIIVSAGAGSGKTAVLTSRLIYFIKGLDLNGNKLDVKYRITDFCILTFTVLASTEMRERIRKALIQENLLEDAQMVDYATITTFDSFANSIVKKYYYKTNISKNFTCDTSNVLTVYTINTINEVLKEYYDSNNDLFDEFICKCSFTDDDNVVNMIQDILNISNSYESYEEFEKSFINDYYNDEFVNKVIDSLYNELSKKRNELLEKARNLPELFGSKDADSTIKNIVFSSLKDLFNATTYDEILSFDFIEPIGQSGTRLIKDIAEKAKVKEFKKDFGELKKYTESLPSSSDEIRDSLTLNKKYSTLLLEIAKKVIDKVDSFKHSKGVYTISDISRLASKIVAENEDIRLELKNKYKMIMIDEYQDTSLLQDNFINMIQNNNVYMVGDVKQSIYLFRNARVDLFIKKYDEYKNNNGGIAIDMNKNFRSRPEVLEDINTIFKTIMTKDCGGADYFNHHQITSGNTNYLNHYNKDNSYHLSFYSYENNGSKNNIEREVHIIAKDIVKKISNHYQVMDEKIENNKRVTYLRDAKLSDFCILCDRSSGFGEYTKIFQEVYGLPLSIEYDQDIKDNSLFLIIKNFLICLNYLYNNIELDVLFNLAFIGLARSFVFNYSDDEISELLVDDNIYKTSLYTFLTESIKKYQDLPISSLIINTIIDSSIYERIISICNVDANINLIDSFISKFNNMDSLEYNLSDYIAFFDSISEYELKYTITNNVVDNTVKLMNIHKSKGLEFNIVYYAGTFKEFNINDQKIEYRVSKDYGLIIPVRGKVNFLKELDNIIKRKEDLSEKIRLLYVALTRCKDKIIVLNPVDNRCKEKDTLKNTFEHYNNKNITLSDILNDYSNDLISDDVFFRLMVKNNIILPLQFSFNEHNDNILNSYTNLSESNIEDYIKDMSEYPNRISYASYYYDKYLNNEITKDEINNILSLTNTYYDSDKKLIKRNSKTLNMFDYFLYEKEILNIVKLTSDNQFDKEEMLKIIKYTGYTINDKFRDFVLNSIKTATDYSRLKRNKYELFGIVDILNIPSSLPLIDNLLSDYLSSINKHDDEILLDRNHFIKYFDLYFNNSLSVFLNDLFLSLYSILVNNTFGKIDIQKVLSDFGIDISLDELNKISQLKNSINCSYLDLNYEFNRNINYFLNNRNITKLINDYLINSNEYLINLVCMIFGYHHNNIVSLNSVTYIKNKQYVKDIEDAKSFKDLLDHFSSYEQFDNIYKEKDSLNKRLDNSYSNIDFLETNSIEYNHIYNEKFNVNQVKNNNNVSNKHKHASKPISYNTNVDLTTLGTRLHFVFEMFDFESKDMSLFSEEEQSFLNKFINSILMKKYYEDVTKALVYKEYEFVDNNTNTSGIIDLMIVYSDEIHIIDYKTKNINDPAYHNQLNTYKTYITNTFNKKVKCYLYSLVLGIEQEVCK